MITYRSVKLVRGSIELSFNASPFSIVDGTWQDQGGQLGFEVVIQCAAWADVERIGAGVQRVLTQAAYASQYGTGDTVYVYTKTCDAISTVTEIGATWKRKSVLSGSAVVTRWMEAPGSVTAHIAIALQVKPLWSRVAPQPLLEATAGLAGYSEGGLVLSAATGAYVKRLGFSSATGLTARFFWVYATPLTTQVNFMRLSANFRAYYGVSGGFRIRDESGNDIGNLYPVATGDIVEVVCRWTTVEMAIFVNGALVAKRSRGTTWPSTPDRYRLLELDAAAPAQTFLSAQVWPTALTDSEIEDLASWGRPECELPFTITPSDGATPTPCENTSATWKLYNTPGTMPAKLKALVVGYTADYDALAVGLHTNGVPTVVTGGPVVKFECESGTLGADTASTADASASNGAVARFTPTATTWVVRTSISVCADAVHVDPYNGAWRLMLNAKDNAANIQINSIRWRMKVAGVTVGEYSDEYSLPSVSTRCLIDLGELIIPPVSWPEGASASTGTEYSGAYLSIEIEAMNSTGSGGGTLDLDAIYLAPADIEATATASTWDVSEQLLCLDFASDPAAPCVIYDTWRTNEWGGVVTWEGTALELPPSLDPNDGALLWLYTYRDTSYQALPKDTLYAWLFVTPTWSA